MNRHSTEKSINQIIRHPLEADGLSIEKCLLVERQQEEGQSSRSTVWVKSLKRLSFMSSPNMPLMVMGEIKMPLPPQQISKLGKVVMGKYGISNSCVWHCRPQTVIPPTSVQNRHV